VHDLSLTISLLRYQNRSSPLSTNGFSRANSTIRTLNSLYHLDPELAHMQYVHPSSLAGGIGQLSADGGFAGLGVDNDDISGDREGGLRLWEAKYQFQKDMLPMFVGEAFGKKVSSYKCMWVQMT
jgi:hypothetical protein